MADNPSSSQRESDADRRPYVPNLDDYYAEIGEDRRAYLNEEEYR